MRSAGINLCGRCSSYFAVPFCFLCVWFYFHWDQWQKLLRFPGEENLALRQRRMLFIAADNDSFTTEQQCGYNSTLPRNMYDYFHRRKYSVAFCSSFIWSCSEVLHTKLGNRLTLHICGILSWLQYLFSRSLSFRLDYLVWYVQILESLSEWYWKMCCDSSNIYFSCCLTG